MFFKLKLFTISLACLAFHFLSAAPTITHLKELSKELETANSKTLVVFDVDEVLITTEDHFIHPNSDNAFLGFFGKEMEKAKTPEEKKELEEKISLTILLPKRVLIEEETPKMIKDLQQRGIKVIALTSCITGPFGVIPKVETWRIEHLASLGINFSVAFPQIKPTYLTELNTRKPSPLFEQGCLFSKGYKKGEVLKAFFKQHNYYPEKVIFIDDLPENIVSVEAELATLGIECKAFHYIGAERFFKTVDVELLHYQFNHLLEKREWLSDVETAKHLKRS